MFGLDPDIGTSTVRLWVAAGSAALLVFICALAFDWTRTRAAGRVTAVVIGAVLGGAMAWAFLNAATVRDRSAERRTLETRAAALNLRVLAPGSPLSCLDALSGDSVEAACEKALFATPANVAMATSYVAARLALLADMNAYTQRGGGNIDGALLSLRRGLEADRFGFVAHLLALRDGCTSDHCQALSLLHDTSKVRAHLNDQTLDHYLDRYTVAWATGAAAGDTSPAPGPVAAQTGEVAAPKKSVLNIDFPSADSIPAVSIMNPEPKGPVTPASAEAAVAAGQQSSAKVVGPQQMPPMPGTPTASAAREHEHEREAAKGKRKPAANPPPARTASQSPPPQSAPPADPVWAPGATLASPQAPVASAPAVSSAQSGVPLSGVPLSGMPIQLSPFASGPQGASH